MSSNRAKKKKQKKYYIEYEPAHGYSIHDLNQTALDFEKGYRRFEKGFKLTRVSLTPAELKFLVALKAARVFEQELLKKKYKKAGGDTHGW